MKKLINNKKFKLALYILLVAIFIASIIVTIVKGLNVGTNYSEGTLVKFSISGQDLEINDIKPIAEEIWPGQKLRIEKVELFNDSISIKVEDYKDEDLQTLCDKLNEKYSKELKTDSDFYVEHTSNVRLRNLILPYILPIGISALLIIAYYAIRFKGTREMLGLIKNLLIFEGLFYSILALCRVPVDVATMPIVLIIYIAIVIIYTSYQEYKLK